MTAHPPKTVLILGAGLTGLTAAYQLSRRGYRVTLLDHSGWQDGFGANASDVAPTLFGCHQETSRLLDALDDTASTKSGRTIPLEFRLPNGRVVGYRSTHLPGALQWMMSLFGFHGLPWHDRWKLFSHLEQIWEQARILPDDLHNRFADEWLTSIGQSRTAREHIWSPLAQWMTGNASYQLSAAVFVQQLSIVFLGQAQDARLTHLTGSVGERLIAPLRARLDRLGVPIQSQSDPPSLRFEPAKVSSLQLTDGSAIKADWFIAALPPWKLLALIPERLLTRYGYFAQIGELETLQEISVQFTCRSTTNAPRLLLLSGELFHHLTITPLGPQAVACRLSATGKQALTELPDEGLIDRGKSALHTVLPELGTDGIQSMEVYREEQAALSLRPGSSRLRPIHQSPFTNLLIAGPWTDTGWPANVESAITSAVRCAEIITGHPARP